MQQLHSSIGTVAYPALSRAQGDPKHLRRSFLEAYSVLISITIPMTLCCALFSEEIVAVVLGAKWASAASIFRLLAPAILALGLVNPFGWFLQSTGRAVRSLNIAFLIAPIVILGVIIGMHYGPQGVALGYSSAMLLLVWPIVAWAKHGTGITAGDYWDAIKWSLFAGVIAGGLGVAFKVTYASAWPAGLVFVLGPAIVLLVYGVLLLGVMGQRAVYRDLLTHALRRPSTPAKDSSRTDSN
jgi:PST family polysaccharide transporter